MGSRRILYIGPHLPSPIAVRPWLFLRTLAGQHRIDLITLEAGSHADGLWQRAQRFRPQLLDRVLALRHLPERGFPLQAMAVESSAMAKAIRSAVDRGGYDVIHVEHARALHMVPREAWPNVLFDSVDCLSQLFQQAAPYQRPAMRAVFTLEAARLARFEATAMRRVGRVLVASRRDAGGLRGLGGDAPIAVLPNPVDLEAFRPAIVRSLNTVVFTGKMSYHANRVAACWLIDEIWPLVERRHPQARLLIAGARPPAELLRRRRQGIEITGYVPELGRVIAGAGVAVAPLRYAVGIQNKVLEAMACAVPVVTTSAAVGDLRFQEGGHGFVANDAAAFAERICWLLDDRRTAADMGEAARAYVERHHAVAPLAAQLERHYDDLYRPRTIESVTRKVEAI
jgi:glycosyltransferase involved in cell wall biosynthesis